MPTSKIVVYSSALVLLGALGCGTGEPPGPRGGSPEWHWENAAFYYERGEFSKMVGELDTVVERDTPLGEKAIVWRTALLLGLSRGYMDLGDAFRGAIEKKEDLSSSYLHALQQANRDARQFAIALTESLGEVDGAMSGETLVCEFPFPGGAASESLGLSAIRDAKPPKPKQVETASDLALRRGIILATTEYCGFGDGEDNVEKARAAFEAGRVEAPADEARLTLAKMLLDVSLVFSRERVHQPDIRKIMIDRAEKWAAPYLTSEDADLKKRARAFQKEIEDERRDMKRKSRRVKKRK